VWGRGATRATCRHFESYGRTLIGELGVQLPCPIFTTLGKQRTVPQFIRPSVAPALRITAARPDARACWRAATPLNGGNRLMAVLALSARAVFAHDQARAVRRGWQLLRPRRV